MIAKGDGNMKIEVIGKGSLKVTKDVTEYSEKKLQKVLGFFDEKEVESVVVLLKDYKEYKKVEITVKTIKELIRAEEKGQDFKETIDLSIDKLVRQITKLRDKMISSFKKERKEKDDLDLKGLEKELLATQLVKNKKITLTTLTKEEALLAMELVGHEFYIYHDVDLNKTCVVYKREDGGYALIETNI